MLKRVVILFLLLFSFTLIGGCSTNKNDAVQEDEMLYEEESTDPYLQEESEAPTNETVDIDSTTVPKQETIQPEEGTETPVDVENSLPADYNVEDSVDTD